MLGWVRLLLGCGLWVGCDGCGLLLGCGLWVVSYKLRVGKCKAKTNCAFIAQFGDPSYRERDLEV